MKLTVYVHALFYSTCTGSLETLLNAVTRFHNFHPPFIDNVIAYLDSFYLCLCKVPKAAPDGIHTHMFRLIRFICGYRAQSGLRVTIYRLSGHTRNKPSIKDKLITVYVQIHLSPHAIEKSSVLFVLSYPSFIVQAIRYLLKTVRF